MFKDKIEKLPPLGDFFLKRNKQEEKDLRCVKNNTQMELPVKHHIYNQLIEELFNPKEKTT